eukprot:1429433-Amphidinium_carterae.1
MEQFGHSEQLLHVGAHLHVAQLDNTVNTRYSPTSATTLIVGDIEELSQSQHTTTTGTNTTLNKTRTRRAQDYTHALDYGPIHLSLFADHKLKSV